MKNSVVAGVDIGGSHITVALIDLHDRKIIADSLKRETVNADGTAGEIITAWASVIRSCFASSSLFPGRAGVAMPGPFDYTTGISFMKDQGKYRALYGLNVGQLLASALDTEAKDISFTNDAACFLQGELFGGVAKGYRRVFGITLGTGFGSAVAVNGRAADADMWRAPFKDGIAENYFSHTALVSRYKLVHGKPVGNVRELALLAEADKDAREVFNEMGANLGEFLAPVLKENASELLVLGGNIARAFNWFYPALKAMFDYHSLKIPVKVTALGEHAALVGAASEWCLPIPHAPGAVQSLYPGT